LLINREAVSLTIQKLSWCFDGLDCESTHCTLSTGDVADFVGKVGGVLTAAMEFYKQVRNELRNIDALA
jgi:hypothetical protein